MNVIFLRSKVPFYAPLLQFMGEMILELYMGIPLC
jgi:hypothetical protein